ncbi:MAG: SDR family oxidoreductase [Rhizobiaceae bacterium]|nr:SDR family oxidoreductase [Rhizobiaceae bacterium]
MANEGASHSMTRALVTGGAQGIGFAVARQLVQEGCRSITLVGRSEAKGQRAVAALGKTGARVHFVGADLASVDDCRRAATAAFEALGGVDVLINAAGSSARGSLTDTSPELFDHLFATNVRGPFFLMQEVVRHLLDAGRPGAIVNVLSMSAHCGQDFLAAYSASKGALATLTKNAALAYRANRIRCNAVLPGWMDTEGESEVQRKFHDAPDDWLAKAEAAQPFGQLVKPDQLAELICWMAGPRSGVMTGALVDYDQNVAGAI